MATATVTRARSGTFVWEELITDDLATARDFYGEILGWSLSEEPISADASYTLFHAGEFSVAGGFETDSMPAAWFSYIGVDSVDEAAARAVELGAKIVREPMDVMEIGRASLLQDPTGALVSIWEAKGEEDPVPAPINGTVCWREVVTEDIERTLEFYREWLGWSATKNSFGEFTYYTLSHGEQLVGGAMQMMPGAVDSCNQQPRWGIVFNVDDVDDTYETALSNGATSIQAPHDLEGVGRFAGLKDPAGAAFGIMKPLPQG